VRLLNVTSALVVAWTEKELSSLKHSRSPNQFCGHADQNPADLRRVFFSVSYVTIESGLVHVDSPRFLAGRVGAIHGAILAPIPDAASSEAGQVIIDLRLSSVPVIF